MAHPMRGRKTAERTPKKGLPSPFQKALEPGTQDFIRPPTRSRGNGIYDGGGYGDGGEDKQSPSPPSTITKTGLTVPDGAAEVCDRSTERLGHRHQDPGALVQHLSHLGHDQPRELICDYGVELISVALRELGEKLDHGEDIRTLPGWLTWRLKKLRAGEPPTPPRNESGHPFLQAKPAQSPEEEETERQIPVVITATDPQAQALWEGALGVLEGQLPRATFETWLKNTKGHSFQDGGLVVVVPSPFVIAWLDRTYHSIAKVVEAVAGESLSVLFSLPGDDGDPSESSEGSYSAAEGSAKTGQQAQPDPAAQTVGTMRSLIRAKRRRPRSKGRMVVPG